MDPSEHQLISIINTKKDSYYFITFIMFQSAHKHYQGVWYMKVHSKCKIIKHQESLLKLLHTTVFRLSEVIGTKTTLETRKLR